MGHFPPQLLMHMCENRLIQPYEGALYFKEHKETEKNFYYSDYSMHQHAPLSSSVTDTHTAQAAFRLLLTMASRLFLFTH